VGHAHLIDRSHASGKTEGGDALYNFLALASSRPALSKNTQIKSAQDAGVDSRVLESHDTLAHTRVRDRLAGRSGQWRTVELYSGGRRTNR
jgi:hypothetical protein